MTKQQKDHSRVHCLLQSVQLPVWLLQIHRAMKTQKSFLDQVWNNLSKLDHQLEQQLIRVPWWWTWYELLATAWLTRSREIFSNMEVCYQRWRASFNLKEKTGKQPFKVTQNQRIPAQQVQKAISYANKTILNRTLTNAMTITFNHMVSSQ